MIVKSETSNEISKIYKSNLLCAEWQGAVQLSLARVRGPLSTRLQLLERMLSQFWDKSLKLRVGMLRAVNFRLLEIDRKLKNPSQ